MESGKEFAIGMCLRGTVNTSPRRDDRPAVSSGSHGFSEMILCITPNPAIDRTLILPNLTPGDVHRAGQVIVAAGGKGLNVARAIETLGGRSLCMGFLGGHTGHLFVDLAQDVGLAGSWTWTDSETRTCTILVAQNGDGTVINETGVPVPSSAWKRLKRDVRRNISATSLVCVCGSLPHHSSPEDWYGLLKLLVVSKKQVWVDTSGRALDAALALPGIWSGPLLCPSWR